MNELTLYDFELDENCYRVRLFLAILGQSYEKIVVDMIPGAEQTRPPLRDLNPMGTLPILRDARSGLVLRDAEAILAYLACRCDPARTWLPAGPEDFGVIMSWLTFSARDLSGAVQARLCALFGIAGDETGRIQDDRRAHVRRALRLMDDHMTARGFSGGIWFSGKHPTLADITLFPSVALSRDIGIDHDAYPALRRWMRQIRALPGFIAMPGIPDYH